MVGIRRSRFVEKIGRKWQQLKNRSQYVAINPSFCDACHGNKGSCYCTSPDKVPRGFLALYVGKEHKRFVVPAVYLNHPAFKMLLQKAKEEFGFSQKGALTLPCSVGFFEYCLLLIRTDDDPTASTLDSAELEKYYMDKYHLSVETVALNH